VCWPTTGVQLHYPIGGTVKRVSIRLSVDEKHQTETAIALSGVIAPAFSKQRIRVDLWDPSGALRVIETTTGPGGTFAALFDLRFEPSLDADRQKWKKAKAMLKGVYRAQARVLASEDVASTESAFVFITR
jgi:hypothetical protein